MKTQTQKNQQLHLGNSNSSQTIKTVGLVVAILVDVFLIWQLLMCWGVL